MSGPKVRWEVNAQACVNRFLDGFLWACGAMSAVSIAVLIAIAVSQ